MIVLVVKSTRKLHNAVHVIAYILYIKRQLKEDSQVFIEVMQRNPEKETLEAGKKRND